MSSKDDQRRRRLREEARQRLAAGLGNVESMPRDQLNELVHELEVHRIELELQNEELRRAQEDLAESRGRYWGLFEFAPVAYLTLDSQGRILEANDAAAGLLGETRQNLRNLLLETFIRAADQGSFRGHFETAVGEDGKTSCELHVVRRDGSVAAVLTESRRLGERADTEGVHVAMVDITQQVRLRRDLTLARARLEERVEERTAELAEAVRELEEEVARRKQAQGDVEMARASLDDAQALAHVGSWDCDVQRDHMWWSGELYRILGLDPEDFYPRPGSVLERLHPEDRTQAAERIDQARRDCRDCTLEYRIIRPDGRERHVRERVRFVCDEYGSIYREIGTLQDITRDKIQQDRIHEDQRLLRALTEELLLTEEHERSQIATAIHDSIAQTLAFTKRELGTLLKTMPPEIAESLERVREYIGVAITETRDLTRDISTPTLRTFGLGAALEELAEQCTARHDLTCTFRGPENPPLSEHVRVLLYRSVRELLMNAAKHSGADAVEIDLERTEEHVRAIVCDNGRGFDPAAADTRQSREGGFGLLSIRERLINVGGRLEIEAAPGEGARFTLTVPLVAEENRSRRPIEEVLPPRNGKAAHPQPESADQLD